MAIGKLRSNRRAQRQQCRREGKSYWIEQDNKTADLRIVILGIVAFLAALFLVTKLALGL